MRVGIYNVLHIRVDCRGGVWTLDIPVWFLEGVASSENENGDGDFDDHYYDKVDSEEKQTEAIALEAAIDAEKRESGGKDSENESD